MTKTRDGCANSPWREAGVPDMRKGEDEKKMKGVSDKISKMMRHASADKPGALDG